MTERFSGYYVRRLLDFASNRKQRVVAKFPPYTGQRIERMSDEVYDVASSKQDGTVYTVNIATVMCTCFAGSAGKCCKHVHYVLTETQHLSQSVSYHFSDKRSLFYEVAIGSPAPSGWLDLLHGGLNQTRSASVEVPAPVDVPVPLEVPSPVEVQNPAEILDPAEEIAQHIATVDRLFKTKVHDVARENPDAFISAYKTFIDTLQSLSTANAAASALHTFGKYAGGGKIVQHNFSVNGYCPPQEVAERQAPRRGWST